MDINKQRQGHARLGLLHMGCHIKKKHNQYRNRVISDRTNIRDAVTGVYNGTNSQRTAISLNELKPSLQN